MWGDGRCPIVLKLAVPANDGCANAARRFSLGVFFNETGCGTMVAGNRSFVWLVQQSDNRLRIKRKTKGHA